ncbi:hypothetical protein PCANB_002788 [Pneumocystis canis]|nr:hypothetical protein PCANB_002788 [Pneumocystis canis]
MNQFEEICEFSIFWITLELITREEQIEYLNNLRKIIINEWKQYSKNYVWYDAKGIQFFLKDLPPYLQGKIWYGNSIEDEWIIVFILYKLSQNYSEIFIRIIDNDGEFLLIEGAVMLPRWLNVWLNNGQILLIPPNQTTKNIEEMNKMKRKIKGVSLLTLNDALFFLRNTPELLIHNIRLEKRIFRRIRGYPEKIKDHQHRTRIIVPRTVAYLLHTSPGLIAAAAHEFYLRDPISLKACEKMTIFPPKDMVSIVVRTTKILHAQLKGQLFQKHPLFNLPTPGSLNYEEAVMGMKITCGFEMLCSKVPENNPAYILKTDPNWISFLEKLKLAGYFENEKEGSAKYKLLEKHAEECFLKSHPYESFPSSINDPISQVFDLLKQTLPSDEEISQWPNACDSDDFLNVTPHELDELMRFKTEISSDDDINTIKTTKQKHLSNNGLKSVVEKFENFVNNEDAGFEGIDFDSDSFTSSASTDSYISFDDEEFIKLIKETLGEKKPKYFFKHVNSSVDISDDQRTEMQDNSQQDDLILDNSTSHCLKQIDSMENESISDKPVIQDFMDAMDTELSSTTLKDSFSNIPIHASGSIDEQNKDVNIQYNLLKNLFESVHGQEDSSGPASTLLKTMHLSLPSDSSTTFDSLS